MERLRRLPLHERELPLRLPPSGEALSRESKVAWGVAFLLHLIALCFIRIEERPASVAPPSPTIVVTVDHPPRQEGGEVLTSLPELVNEVDTLGGATAEQPSIPKTPSLVIDRHRRPNKQELSQHDPFDHLVHHEFHPEKVDFGLMRRRTPIRLSVTGPLAEIPLLEDGLAPINSHLKGEQPMKTEKLAFKVKINGEDGRVIWFQSLASSERDAINELGEQVVRFLRFEPLSHTFVAEGVVELQLSVDPESKLDLLLTDLEHLQEEVR